MKLRPLLLLLQVITVKSSLLNLPYLVTSKTVPLKDKKLSKPFFVLVLKLLVLLLPVLLINTVDTVVLQVLFQLPVLEEDLLKLDFLLMLLTEPTKPIPPQLLQPLLKLRFMSNHLLPLQLLLLVPLLPNNLLITKSLLPLMLVLLKPVSKLLLPLQLSQLLPKKSLLHSKLVQLLFQLGLMSLFLVLLVELVTCGV